MGSINLQLVLILTFGFGFASLLGYLSYRARLSPLLGYLLAGYLIGPYSPGFTADLKLAEQMAEIGVILMMFGVGMHFKWQDLVHTAPVAVPGAIIQVVIAAMAGGALMLSIGWTIEASLIFGLAIGVASTVVLMRVLSDNHLLHTPEGHLAVGWLIVEDLITVGVLLLIEPLASASKGESLDLAHLLESFGLTLFSCLLLALFMFTVGKKIVSFIFSKIMLTKSHELFTLTILSITFLIASGSAYLLGTSIALGAFLAGLMIGQTRMSKEISDNSTPLKDAFVVIFFLSIGMLFNPAVIFEHFSLFSLNIGHYSPA